MFTRVSFLVISVVACCCLPPQSVAQPAQVYIDSAVLAMGGRDALLAIREAGLPLPACGWCISPWVDMEAIGDSMISKATTDPTVQKAGIVDMAKHYLNGADPRSPLAAPIYADLRGLAPLLIQVGAAETLLDDAIRLAQVAGTADVAVDLQIWPEMIHVWHTYFAELAAGRRAIAAGGEFARAMTSRGTRSGF